MKQRLFWLCLALISFMMVDKAAASLHLKQNPTQLEPGSYALSEESYQVAKVTWLPDYLGNNKSYGKDRVNAGGKDISGRNCAKYGFVDSCGDGTGTVVHPTVGLTCYKNCKASCSSLGYVDKCSSTQTGTAVTTEDGSTCYKDCKCPITYRYTTSSDLTPKMLGRAAFVSYCASPALVAGESCSQTYVNTTTSQTETAVLYKECNCPSEYNSNLQANGTCTPCTDGKGVTQYACVANCQNYPLTVCPPGGTCSPCPIDSSKLKLVSCDKENGWTMSANEETCIATSCPTTGYTAGLTECSGTNYYYSSNGKSGGLVCGKCTLKDDNCPSGYQKPACSSTQKQTGTTTSAAGTTCYKCEESYTLPTRNYIKIAVNAPEDGLTLKFDLSGSGYVIDWGDGTHNSSSSHTYAKAGNYDVVMSEGITKLVARGGSIPITKLYTLDMDTITEASFSANCKQLTGTIPNFPPSLTNGSEMFYNCTNLTGNIPQLPSTLTDAQKMFEGCTGLDGKILGFSSSLTNGYRMFYNCTSLTGDIPQLPSSLTDGSSMFYNCTGLNGKILGLSSGLTKGSSMFFNCKGLTGSIPPLPSSLTNGHMMFSDCTNLTGDIPPLPSSLTNGARMFANCTGLNGKILGLQSGLTNGESMFSGCSGLTGSIPELPSGLTNGNWMFWKCASLTGDIPQLPSSLTTGQMMFSSCKGLNGKILGLPSGLTNGTSMFSGCSGLTGSIPDLPSGLTNGESMFQSCSGLTGNIPQLPSSLTNGSLMFAFCSKLTGSIPLLPSGLTDVENMFLRCLGLSGATPAKPANVTRCFGIFTGTNITTTPEWQSCQ